MKFILNCSKFKLINKMQRKKLFITSDKINEIQEAYAYFDLDGNGVLSF